MLNLDNTTQTRTILQNLVMRPRSLCLNPKQGVMYIALWSELFPMQGAINFAHMDGTNHKQFVGDTVRWPVGLTLDRVGKRLYWSDQHKQTIESVDFNGNNRRIELSKELGQPMGLALNDGRIFVISKLEGVVKVFRNNVSEDAMNRSSNIIYDIKIFDPESQQGKLLMLNYALILFYYSSEIRFLLFQFYSGSTLLMQLLFRCSQSLAEFFHIHSI